MPCTTKSVYESVEACPGQRILPGVRRRLYYINKSDIAAWPSAPSVNDENVTMAQLARYVGDFTLVADKYFQFIDLKDEASNAKFEPVGENGSKLFNNQAEAVVAGISDDIKGFSSQALNDDVIYVFQQRDGKFCVLGNEMFKCNTSPTGDSGTDATSATTTSVSIQVYDERPIPTYVGKLMLSATQYMDCADGEIKTVQEG